MYKLSTIDLTSFFGKFQGCKFCKEKVDEIITSVTKILPHCYAKVSCPRYNDYSRNSLIVQFGAAFVLPVNNLCARCTRN